MPHKRNPTSAVLALASARHAAANAALLLGCAEQEHERAAGAWHAEWQALTTALSATGGAAAALRRSLTGLEVDSERMRGNISDATLSEARRLGIEAATPADYLGSAGAFVDRALEHYRR
jgi:3-carboxy-cis,cis-muconate cycloisomerase